MTNPYAYTTTDDPAQQVVIRQAVRGTQIITGAMCMGVLVFLGIALWLQGASLDGEPDLLSWFAVGFAVILYINHLAFPRIVQAGELKKLSAAQMKEADAASRWDLLFPIFRTQHIIACAMLEGAAFLNLVAYIVEPFVGNLAAAVLLLVLIALKIPTETRLQFWVQDRVRELELS